MNCKRHRETFASASLARRWLMDVRAKTHVGQLEPPARKRKQRLKDGEEDELLRAASQPDGIFKHSPDVVWLIRWSIEQGSRLGESFSLRWQDIDFHRQTFPRSREE